MGESRIDAGVSQCIYGYPVAKKRDLNNPAAKSAELLAQERRKERNRNLLIIGGAGAIAIALIAGAVVSVQRERTLSDPSKIEGLVTTKVESGDHREGNIAYPSLPPAGGPHNAQWLNCGVYTQPQKAELAVHSLEHGAVWISYKPGLAEADIAKLTKFANGDPYILVTPLAEQDSAIVLTAWGLQLKVDSVDDERIERFVRSFSNGPQTPEPGAVCFGGIEGPGRVAS